MNYNDEISDIQSDMLNEMPSSYSKVKGNWLWEMFKAFSIKLYELLQLLTDTAEKLNVEKLRGDELDAYVKQWTDIKRKTAQRASGYIEVRGNGTIYSGTIVSNGVCQYEVLADAEVNETAVVPVVAVSPGGGLQHRQKHSYRYGHIKCKCGKHYKSRTHRGRSGRGNR